MGLRQLGLGGVGVGVGTGVTGGGTIGVVPMWTGATALGNSAAVAIVNGFADGGGQVYNAKAYGLTCNGSVDDTTAFNALLTTVYAAGGGTIWLPGIARINGAVLLPNDGASPPTQPYIRITGPGSSAQGSWAALPASPGGLDLRYAAGPKLDTRGGGLLEIDHIVLKDGGADSAAFIRTTNTTLHIHDVAFSGTASGVSAVNDAIILGGTTTTIDGTATAPFQGYGTVIENNWFDKIRRGVWLRVYANSVVIKENTWGVSCGSNLTTAITAATNAAAAVLTSVGNGFTVGTTYSMTISGATGNWAPINGIRAVTPLTVDTFSIPVDSTTFGALTGSPVYLSGGAIELDGTGAGGAPANYATGNVISGNLVEMVHYPSFVVSSWGKANYFDGNGLWDSTGLTIAFYRFTNSTFNLIIQHLADTSAPLAFDTATSNWNSIIDPGSGHMSTWAEPWTFKNTAQFTNLGSGDVPLAGANGLLTRDDGLTYTGAGATMNLRIGGTSVGLASPLGSGLLYVTNGTSTNPYGSLKLYQLETLQGVTIDADGLYLKNQAPIFLHDGSSYSAGIVASSPGVIKFTDASAGGASATVGSKTTAFTSASAAAVNIANVAVASNSSTSGEVGFEIELSDGTDFSVLRGRFAYVATNKAGVLAVAAAPTVFGSQTASSTGGGATSATATVTTGTNLIHLNVVPVWTVMTPTVKNIRWRIDSTQTDVITAIP